MYGKVGDLVAAKSYYYKKIYPWHVVEILDINKTKRPYIVREIHFREKRLKYWHRTARSIIRLNWWDFLEDHEIQYLTATEIAIAKLNGTEFYEENGSYKVRR